MSDPSDDWGTEAQWDPADANFRTLSLCRVSGWWLETFRNPDFTFVTRRASSLDGPWEEVGSHYEGSFISAANDVAAHWVYDGGWALRWSDDAFSTSTDLALPTGWQPTFAQFSQENLQWDGERWGLIVDTGPNPALVYTTDFSSLTVNTTTDGGVITGELPVFGSPGGGWNLIGRDVAAGFSRMSIVYGDDFASPFTSVVLFNTVYPGGESDAKVPYWAGGQAAFIDIVSNPQDIWVAPGPNSTYEQVTGVIPDGFQVFPANAQAYGYAPIRWDIDLSLWVIIGTTPTGVAIAVTPDLGEPWQLVDLDLPTSSAFVPDALRNQAGEWFATVVDGSSATGGVLMPGNMAGDGWGLIL